MTERHRMSKQRRPVIDLYSSSDEDEESIWGRSNQQQKRLKTDSKATLLTSIEYLADPKKAIIEQIKEPRDQWLQALLWEIHCSYNLYEHQFQGVRALAGVPDDFPSINSQPTLEILRTAQPRHENDRGIIMADVMGLGKTVVGVAACILRNAMADAKKQPKKPTFICSPNDAVLKQWHQTLLNAGVDPKKIFRFKTKRHKPLKGDIFILCNRYDLQTEARYIFNYLKNDENDASIPKSPLFPNSSETLLRILKNQYRADKGKEKNKYNDRFGQRIPICECITHYLAQEAANLSLKEAVFQTVVIDEAHFLKSLKTFWGMAAALLGLHTARMIPMTGTPFNNSLQDMASLMSFIAPADPSAKEKWWKAATERGAAHRVVRAISGWSSNYLLRRGKDVIANQLPAKIVRIERVVAYPLELTVYEEYEAKFLSVLQQLHKLNESENGTPFQRKQMNDCLQVMLAVAACMRAALIHPVLPGGGRDVTVLFSPTRSKMRSVLKGQEKRNLCVCCNRRVKVKVQKKQDTTLVDALNSLDDKHVNDEDDDLFILDDEEELPAKMSQKKKTRFQSEKGTGDIVPIPFDRCKLGQKGIRHFACESCLDNLEEKQESCPRCTDLFSRLRCESGARELEASRPDLFVDAAQDHLQVPRKVYCQETFGGFRVSAKLESLVADFETKVPPDEKVLIVSFFKGSLDLLEAIFSELGVDVARFDGDVKSDERDEVLERFKTDTSVRVLLATVQCGGTGLNLVAANHVWFCDRFWNPMVMEQCEDRCYRLKQTRDVHVVYQDVSSTIDDVMRHINEVKSTNAAVLLADGSALSTPGVAFKDISGFLGSAIHALRELRSTHIKQSPENIMAPLPLPREGMLDSVRARSMRDTTQIPSMVDTIATMRGYGSSSSSPLAVARSKPDSGRIRPVQSLVQIPSMVDSTSSLRSYDLSPPIANRCTPPRVKESLATAQEVTSKCDSNQKVVPIAIDSYPPNDASQPEHPCAKHESVECEDNADKDASCIIL